MSDPHCAQLPKTMAFNCLCHLKKGHRTNNHINHHGLFNSRPPEGKEDSVGSTGLAGAAVSDPHCAQLPKTMTFNCLRQLKKGHAEQKIIMALSMLGLQNAGMILSDPQAQDGQQCQILTVHNCQKP